MSWLIACALGVQRTTDILNSGRGWLKNSLFLYPQFSQGVVVEASLKGLNRDNARVREVCISTLKEVPTGDRIFDAMARGLADTDSWVFGVLALESEPVDPRLQRRRDPN